MKLLRTRTFQQVAILTAVYAFTAVAMSIGG